MVWALLLFIAAIVAVHWWDYQHSLQEYTFAQPAALDAHRELRTTMMEKTPMAVEIGPLPWRPEIAKKAPWSVETTEGLTVSAGAWLEETPRPAIANGSGLADQMRLETGLADLDAGRAWWWLPGLQDTRVDVLPAGGTVGLSWVGAERQWIGCSHGSPLTVWLVHSRYRRYLPTELPGAQPVNPWTLTVEETPWLGRVQYMEVRIRPGWCLGLPAHWGWAVKTEEPEESWWWVTSQQSPLSWALCNLMGSASETDQETKKDAEDVGEEAETQN
jgi:hypothetical protein